MNWRRKRTTWELAYAVWGGHEVLLHLTQGWEPFAVTNPPGEFDGSSDTAEDGTRSLGNPVTYIWFRRQVRA